MRNLAVIAGIGLVLGCAIAIAQKVGAPPGAAQEVLVPPAPWSSPNGGEPEFEVATVKPSDPAKCCARNWSMIGRHFHLQYESQVSDPMGVEPSGEASGGRPAVVG